MTSISNRPSPSVVRPATPSISSPSQSGAQPQNPLAQPQNTPALRLPTKPVDDFSHGLNTQGPGLGNTRPGQGGFGQPNLQGPGLGINPPGQSGFGQPNLQGPGQSGFGQPNLQGPGLGINPSGLGSNRPNLQVPGLPNLTGLNNGQPGGQNSTQQVPPPFHIPQTQSLDNLQSLTSQIRDLAA